MTAREAAREEWRKLKNKPLKDRLVHIGTYYWPYILAGGFLLILAVSTIVTVVSAKEPALQGYFLSTAQREDAADPAQAFCEYAGIDTDHYSVTLTPSSYAVSGSTNMAIADTQIIASQTASKALDILCGDTAVLLNYAYSDYFRDLREILTPEQLENWSEYLLYIDQRVLDAINEGEELAYALPDPSDPTQMENPIPVALIIPQSGVLWDSFTFLGDAPAVGIIINSQHAQTAVRFLEWILQ